MTECDTPQESCQGVAPLGAAPLDSAGKNTAPLTAVLPVEIRHPFLTLDRLSFVGSWKNGFQKGLAQFEQWTRSSMDCLDVRMVGYPYRYTVKTVSGMVIQVRDHSADLEDIRIEFNPAKLPKWQESLGQIVGTLKRCRITRLDFAVDYGVDLSRCMTTTHPRPKKTVIYRGPSMETETVYHGAPDSPLRFRMYNKALEQGQPGPWWRIEAQMRFRSEDSWLKADPFGGFSVGWVNPDINIEDRALLHYLNEFPQMAGELTDYRRRQIRKLMKDEGLKHLDPHPADIYRRDSPAILAQLESLFSLQAE